MKNPRRLLEGSLNAEQRAALNAGLRLAPSERSKQRMWHELSAVVGTVGIGAKAAAYESARALAQTSSAEGGALGSMAGSAVSGSAVSGGAAKLVVSVPAAMSLGKLLVTWSFVGTGLGLGVKWLAEEGVDSPNTLATSLSAPPDRNPPSQAALTRQVQPPGFSAADEQIPEPRERGSGRSLAESEQRSAPALGSSAMAEANLPLTANKNGPASGLPNPALDGVAEESALIAEARAELRAGRPNSCLRRLRDVERRFSRGVLSQERRALTIEALSQVGQEQQARQLAREFAERYPDSPYASKLRALTE